MNFRQRRIAEIRAQIEARHRLISAIRHRLSVILTAVAFTAPAARLTQWVGSRLSAHYPIAETPETKGSIEPLLPLIDEASLDTLRTMISEPKFREIIVTYIEWSQDQLAMIAASADTGDLIATANLLHALKGSSGNLGAHRLQEIADHGEKACRAGDTAAAVGVISQLKIVTDETCEALISWQASMIDPEPPGHGTETRPIARIL